MQKGTPILRTPVAFAASLPNLNSYSVKNTSSKILMTKNIINH